MIRNITLMKCLLLDRSLTSIQLFYLCNLQVRLHHPCFTVGGGGSDKKLAQGTTGGHRARIALAVLSYSKIHLLSSTLDIRP